MEVAVKVIGLGSARTLITGIQINVIHSNPDIAAVELREASRVVKDCGRIVRGGHECLAARGRKGVLVRQGIAAGLKRFNAANHGQTKADD